MIKFIIEALDVDPEKDVVYAAYTGKAVQVLKEKGHSNSKTTHKLLYEVKNEYGRYYFYPRETIPEKIVVIDEVSMLPRGMWDLLLSHRNIHVIACGDPA